VSYFRKLLSANEEVPPSIRPLLKLSRETIERCQKTEYALVSSLQRDPVLADRIKRLRTVPGVGPITALTWALEIGDVSRFGSIKQAISYCGLCGEERSSADKAMRMPPLEAAQQAYPACAGRSRQVGTETEPRNGCDL
jgi:transposase